MTTTPLASDSEAEAAVPTSRRDRQQAEPADRAGTAPTADEPREKVSVASLLLPPVGSVDPDSWRRPVTRSSAPTYRPPEFDAETRAALEAEAAEREAADRAAAARREAERPKATLVPAEPRAAVAAEPVLALTPAAPATSKPRRRKPIVKKVKPTDPRPTPPPPAVEAPPAAEPEEAAEAAVEEQWTSAAPAITHLNRQFFAPPQELKPAPVEDQVMETGHDLQLRIYMREILEPWWTGEVGSTTALNRLVALRERLADDPS